MLSDIDEECEGPVVRISEENTLRMLDYYQNEWLYRHKHFWNLLIKLFVFNLFIAVLPFISNVYEIEFENLEILKFIFPIAAFVITGASTYALFIEADRMSLVGAKKYEINRYMDKLYQYKSDNITFKKNFKAYLIILISMLMLLVIEISSFILVTVN